MEFQQTCPKFLGKQPFHARMGRFLCSHLASGRAGPVLTSRTASEWDGSGLLLRSALAPSFPLPGGRGWLSCAWVACSRSCVTSFPLLAAGALSRWILGSAGDT